MAIKKGLAVVLIVTKASVLKPNDSGITTRNKMINIFDTLSPAKQMSLSKNEYLFHAGDPIKNFYLLTSGRIRMSRLTLDGKQSIIYEGSAGETFAEASLFSEHYHCDATAIEDSTLNVFDKMALLSKLKSDPELNNDYMAMLARQVLNLRSQLELRNINSAAERVYKFLVLNADQAGMVMFSSSLKNTALPLGLAHETLYRTLSKFEKKSQN